MTLRQRKRAKAFSLLEILTVVGIIAVLVTIAVYAFKNLDPSAKVTKSQLENARSMLSEYEAMTGSIKGLPSSNGILNFVGDVTRDGGDSDGDKILNCYDANDPAQPLTKFTRDAMTALLRVPANLQAYNRLSHNLLVELPHDTYYQNAAPGDVLDKALADGWSHPIYFVPGAGIKVKMLNGSTVTVRSPDGRPFFVSAGPDGFISARPGADGTLDTQDDIAAGDDNLYSFNQ